MKNGVTQVTLDVLIEAALTNKPYSPQRLSNQARLYARRLSKSYAKDFPDDLHDEVFGQAFVELFTVGAAGLSNRGGKALFRRAVLSAIRAVRTSYAPPGRRTRPSAKEISNTVAAEDVGRIATKSVEHCTVTGDNGIPYVDFDRFSDPLALASQFNVEDRLEVEKILLHAPDDVGGALRLIYLDDRPVKAVVADLGMTRTTFDRHIERFCSQWRLAA
ncbi:DNA-directed RNA polymerase specialized sigma24 family protein [Rhizobium sp. BK077]|uniref:hypothetical protein n=1 Tax=unclassified Rhizobium TaxID=2613769 RepID=UPI001614EDC3|nr:MULTISPECIES: hypothetical protein [unclassified Rhizobium]MBB3302303.1 DNA-directed RNA polymerase specialized sigma24 family protein [Rhizobium sp. BK112]MBB3371425.1 DNA-directed RNA polymerase specialized sigma24 family protein [Rhizobium sp. BK077]MBB4182086.1 DNA-directed RNA polymerase specialized sigma24 family protein [Rhizobium sp. BK109]MBB4255516.1 DNA-directed RNA polymerase specialized sigma24 family protein [Rhizobium sp. BK008]